MLANMFGKFVHDKGPSLIIMFIQELLLGPLKMMLRLWPRKYSLDKLFDTCIQ